MTIQINGLHMHYPLPRRYREYLLHPLRPRTTIHALCNISMTIENGDRVAILGPNGAGKTTLLKLIGGLLLPTAGTISVHGNDTCADNDRARALVGYVMNEERSLYWRLTARQNLQFFGALNNLFGEDLRERIDSLLNLVDLQQAADREVGRFSSGMKQRLAIARGLLCMPPILIMDEPTRALDPLAAAEVRTLISHKIGAGNGTTLFIATHRLEEVPALCNKLCVVCQGEVLAMQSVHNIDCERSALEQLYRSIVLAPRGSHAY